MNVAPARCDLLATLNHEEITKAQNLGREFTVSDRALRAMISEARRHAPMETMGPLFMAGLVETGFRIELAAPSGPNAEHELDTCYPNVDYYNRWVKWSYRQTKLWFTGQWHTHTFQDVPLPSPWDIWGANQDRQVGWFAWDDEQFNGRGHMEIIVANRVTRAWWITTNPDRIRLVAEIEAGIAK